MTQKQREKHARENAMRLAALKRCFAGGPKVDPTPEEIRNFFRELKMGELTAIFKDEVAPERICHLANELSDYVDLHDVSLPEFCILFAFYLDHFANECAK